MNASNVAVVIPFYKNNLTVLEKISLQQCFKILAAYDIIAVKPDGLDLNNIEANYEFTSTVSFNNAYFEGVEGYNRLMLSENFYQSFSGYTYILIYQLDAFVFTDNLAWWCSLGYDYIGAPWLRHKDYNNVLKTIIPAIRNYFYVRYNAKNKNNEPKILQQLWGRVGNGGLSLRRVDLFSKMCIKHKALIATYTQVHQPWFNEDVFWSIELNRKRKQVKIPSFKKALQFAFETHPERALKLNANQLPFGCHAWDKYIDFWRPVFETYGYKI